MKRTLITKIGEYENITSEVDSLEEALDEHIAIKALFDDLEGLNASEWVQFRKDVLSSDTYTPDMQEKLERCNKSQRYWANQTKLAIRSLTKE